MIAAVGLQSWDSSDNGLNSQLLPISAGTNHTDNVSQLAERRAAVEVCGDFLDNDLDGRVDEPQGLELQPSDVNYIACIFDRADLRDLILDGYNFKRSVFIGTSFANSYLTNAAFTSAGFYTPVEPRAYLAGPSQEPTTNADFTNAVLENANFDRIISRGAPLVFKGADLRNASFIGVHVIGADFSDASMIGAKLQGQMSSSSFINADLSKSHLLIYSHSLRFDHALLTGASINTGGTMLRPSFVGADLSNAVVRDVEGSTRGGNLANADFTDATLKATDLRGANLRGANFQGAVLSGADLTGADLEGAILTGAVLDCMGHEICTSTP